MAKKKLKGRAKRTTTVAKGKRAAPAPKRAAGKAQARSGASPSIAASVFIRSMNIQGS